MKHLKLITSLFIVLLVVASCKEVVVEGDTSTNNLYYKEYGRAGNEYFSYIIPRANDIKLIGGLHEMTRTTSLVINEMNPYGSSKNKTVIPFGDHTWWDGSALGDGSYIIQNTSGPDFVKMNADGSFDDPKVINTDIKNLDWYLYSPYLRGDNGSYYTAISDVVGTPYDSVNNIILELDPDGNELSRLVVPDSVVISGGRILWFRLYEVNKDKIFMCGTCLKTPYLALSNMKTYHLIYDRNTKTYSSTVLDLNEDTGNDFMVDEVGHKDGSVVGIMHNWYFQLGAHSTAGIPWFEAVKIDGNHTILWRNKFTLEVQRLYPVVVEKVARGYIVTGFCNIKGSKANHAFYVVIDNDGNEIASKIFTELEGAEGYHAQMDSEDHVYLAGASIQFGNQKELQVPFLIKCDLQGNYIE